MGPRMPKKSKPKLVTRQEEIKEFLLNVNENELNLPVVLQNGQSFRWKKFDDNQGANPETDNHYYEGVAMGRVWRLRRLNADTISCSVLGHFKTNNTSTNNSSATNDRPTDDIICDSDDDESVLRRYFQLDTVELGPLFKAWCEADAKFAQIAAENHDRLRGLRVLAQAPVENCFSFICSTNNHIPRISSMVESMCRLYGEALVLNGHTYYDFPTVSRLAGEGASNDDVEKTLRDAGFGYRAAYIAGAAKRLQELGGRQWLCGLKSRPYLEAKQELMKLPGVGPKVADCICLMSMGKHDVVPIDTHVWQITTSLYLPLLKRPNKSLSSTAYKQIGDFYREKFGSYAGWAHELLFSSNLKYFTNSIEKTAKNSNKSVQTKHALERSKDAVCSKKTKML